MSLPGLRLPSSKWIAASLLGLATIGAYGTAYYAISVLIPAISEETGWSRGALTMAFSAGVLAQGAVALVAGRRFDRHGSRPVMLPCLIAGAALLLAASFAAEAWQFIAAWAGGAAIIGGGLYYNLTMPAISRLYPDQKAAALSVLTLFGALASPIFYPIAGQMLEMWDWRGTLQGLTALMVLCIAPAALFVKAPGAVRLAGSAPKVSLMRALASPHIHRLLLVGAMAGIASSSLMLSQVPAMQAAGLSLTTATSLAGVRGACQMPGRLFLTPLIRLLGVRRAMGFCYAAAGVASFTLVGGSVVMGAYPAAAAFAVLGGLSLGMLSPLNGLFQAQVFGDEQLGALSGMTVVVGSVAGATGGVLTGLVTSLSGDYGVTMALTSVLYAGAVLALWWQRQAQNLGTVQDDASETPSAVPV